MPFTFRYAIKECTWEEEDSMSDPQRYISEFYKTAKKQGFDPEGDPHSTILLRVAVSGGWKDPNA